MDSLALCTRDSVVFPWMTLNSLSCIIQFIERFGWLGVWCLMPEVFQPYKCFLLSIYLYACLFIGQCKICSIYGETTLFLLLSPFNEGCLQLLQKKLPEKIKWLISIIFSVFEKRLLLKFIHWFIMYFGTDCSLYNDAMNLFF